ncbi:SHOCT domain-containing protein [Lysinibacillus capsici]|uniref:SHOCT domain-containing protein n=1 Tax=Lysinibacillus capsici TaxID=2115968 RepID=UPI001C11713E|nr:SHOCT domain-containing protein [Lysinibacillus capsici]MBU5253327.1 SHOCT domain-containing protein [Lysinibacillus capsici]
MSEWDFLWGLNGKELEDAMISGGTVNDWAYVEEHKRKKSKLEWENLKSLRDSGIISKEEFKKRKTALFSNDINV